MMMKMTQFRDSIFISSNYKHLYHFIKIRGARDCAIIIESDEETDGKFSCMVEVNAGN
ncbi:hypothetical protein RYX36_032743 [Vicia faba]